MPHVYVIRKKMECKVHVSGYYQKVEITGGKKATRQDDGEFVIDCLDTNLMMTIKIVRRKIFLKLLDMPEYLFVPWDDNCMKKRNESRQGSVVPDHQFSV